MKIKDLPKVDRPREKLIAKGAENLKDSEPLATLLRTGKAGKISIKQIQERNYNLNFKNPNGKSAAVHKSPEELVGKIEGKERKITEILGEIRKQI
ncbi:MAG: hypothetical protein HY507_00630 [Candidatus Zambryskibacteria bacterium]|nr:hypothetical protein [Candidatus Zambryskibacteria bacterium]